MLPDAGRCLLRRQDSLLPEGHDLRRRERSLRLKLGENLVIAVLKLGVATILRVAKFLKRVAKL